MHRQVPSCLVVACLLLVSCGSNATGGTDAADAPAEAAANDDTGRGNGDGTTGTDIGAVDAASSDGGVDSIGNVVRECGGSMHPPGYSGCRSANECGPPAPVACFLPGEHWPASFCPFPPFNCNKSFVCTTDVDCLERAGGTCVSYVAGCPQCEMRECRYPPPLPPPCTIAPDTCGPGARCQAGGTCKPISCAEGYSCSDGSRCSTTSSRADTHGCELARCDQGFVCPENTRCTAPTDPSTHGCTSLACVRDENCDCGFCVKGQCSPDLGVCTPAPS